MASQAGRVAAPPADPRLVMPANVSAWAQSGFQAYVRGAKPPWLRRGLRITRVFPCVARRVKACASFMFAGGCWWRSLVVDGSTGASRGHASVVRSPGARWPSAARPSAFQAGHILSWRESCERDAPSPVAAVCRWSLLLLSPLLSATGAVLRFRRVHRVRPAPFTLALVLARRRSPLSD